MILSIDPGNELSAYVVLSEDLTPVDFAKIPNGELRELIPSLLKTYDIKYFACEMIASYGMAVGKTVFDTCVWIGRFTELVLPLRTKYIYRKEVTNNLCNSPRAKDSNVTQALIDRFAPYTPNKGKGTKKEPGFFYGVSKDIWAAIGVGVTFSDLYL